MSLSIDTLKKTARLAALDLDNTDAILADFNLMMAYVAQLRAITAASAPPLVHPVFIDRPLREDLALIESHLPELEQIAPHFGDDLYLVPTVISEGK